MVCGSIYQLKIDLKELYNMSFSKSMTDLFDANVLAINKYLINVYSEGELNKVLTISKMEIVQKEEN